MRELGFVSNFDRVKPDDELPFFLRDSKLHLWNCRDIEGRPFGELLASEAARAGVEFEVRPSKYPGSRNGLGINLSGLRPMTKYWTEIIADVDFVHRSFMARHKLAELTYLHLWQLSKILADLPSFIYVQRHQVSEGIPVRVSGMFRAVIGVVSSVERLLAEGTPPFAPAASGPIIEVAEKGGFLSNGGRACAGPLHMIESFLAAIIHGAKPDVPSAVVELVGDVDLLLHYGELSSMWDLVSQLYRANTRILAERAFSLFASLDRRAREPSAARRAPWAHAQRSAIYHLDLHWFTLADTVLTLEHVAATIPLIEGLLGGIVALDPAPAVKADRLADAIAATLPWASSVEVAELAACWSNYLGVEQRFANIFFQLQRSTPESLRQLGDRHSPLCPASGPAWFTNRDFSMRLGATLGDVFANAFGVDIETSRDAEFKLSAVGRTIS